MNDFLRLESVLWVSFSALTLLIGRQERHPTNKKPLPLITKGSILEQVTDENQGGTIQLKSTW